MNLTTEQRQAVDETIKLYELAINELAEDLKLTKRSLKGVNTSSEFEKRIIARAGISIDKSVDRVGKIHNAIKREVEHGR